MLLPRCHAGEPLASADGIRQFHALPCGELRLGIEQLELRRRSRLEQVDDTPGLRREMRQAGQAAVVSRKRISVHQRSERGGAKSHTAEELPTRAEQWMFLQRVHCLV